MHSNGHGTEADRWNGYLPPHAFLVRVKLALAKEALHTRHHEKADTILQEIAGEYADSFAAPEALYWLGVARWGRSHEFDALADVWRELMATYPNSEAAAKASCILLRTPQVEHSALFHNCQTSQCRHGKLRTFVKV